MPAKYCITRDFGVFYSIINADFDLYVMDKELR